MLCREARSTAHASVISGEDRRRLPSCRLGARDVPIGHHNVTALPCNQQRDLAADAAAAAHDQKILRLNSRFGRHALELGFFQRPVFDPERFRPGKRNVVVEAGEMRDCSRPPRLRQSGSLDARRPPARSLRPSRESR